MGEEEKEKKRKLRGRKKGKQRKKKRRGSKRRTLDYAKIMVIKKLWYIYTMEYYTIERKKELLPFVTASVKLETIC